LLTRIMALFGQFGTRPGMAVCFIGRGTRRKVSAD